MNRFHLNSNFNYKNGGLSLRMGHQKTKRDFQSSFPFQTDAESTQLEIFNKYVFSEEFYTVLGVLIQQNFANCQTYQIHTTILLVDVRHIILKVNSKNVADFFKSVYVIKTLVVPGDIGR